MDRRGDLELGHDAGVLGLRFLRTGGAEKDVAALPVPRYHGDDSSTVLFVKL
jgi:hypothetical protein